VNRRANRNVNAAEGPQDVGTSHGHRADRHPCLQRKVADADLEWAERPPSRVAAFGKHQHDAASREHLVHGPQPSLVELALMRRDWEHTDERQEAALPPGVEDCLSLRHRVNHRTFWKERDDECRVEPRLVVGGNDVRRWWDVLEPADRDTKDLRDQPSHEPVDQAIEARRMLRIRVDERVERGVDERPELRTGVGLVFRLRPARGLGERFGVQVGQMLGAAEQRSKAYSTYA
jgi:hypothetical protein